MYIYVYREKLCLVLTDTIKEGDKQVTVDTGINEIAVESHNWTHTSIHVADLSSYGFDKIIK